MISMPSSRRSSSRRIRNSSMCSGVRSSSGRALSRSSEVTNPHSRPRTRMASLTSPRSNAWRRGSASVATLATATLAVSFMCPASVPPSAAPPPGTHDQPAGLGPSAGSPPEVAGPDRPTPRPRRGSEQVQLDGWSKQSPERRAVGTNNPSRRRRARECGSTR